MFGHDDQKDEDITTINPTLGTDDSVTPADDPSISTDSTAADTAVAPADDAAATTDTSTDITVTDDAVTPVTEDVAPQAPVELVTDTDTVTTEPTTTESGAPAVEVTETETVSEEPTTTPEVEVAPAEETTPEVETPAAEPAVESVTVEEADVTPVAAPVASTGSDDLLELKKETLEELAPLVDQLDQAPAEKFSTLMMMIQATDDSGLVKAAHDAAQQIPDEKAKAQALLDIVNEINYFTQKDTAA